MFVVDQAGVLRVGTGGFDYDGPVKAYTVVVIAQDMGTVSQSVSRILDQVKKLHDKMSFYHIRQRLLL